MRSRLFLAAAVSSLLTGCGARACTDAGGGAGQCDRLEQRLEDLESRSFVISDPVAKPPDDLSDGEGWWCQIYDPVGAVPMPRRCSRTRAECEQSDLQRCVHLRAAMCVQTRFGSDCAPTVQECHRLASIWERDIRDCQSRP